MAETATRLDSAARFGRIAAVVNLGSGGVDGQAPARLEALLASHGLGGTVHPGSGREIGSALAAALQDRPDTLIALGGDGTLATAAGLCVERGIRLMALPGGTMNMLPHALNGRRSWPDALQAQLLTGAPVQVSSGSVGGRPFYVNAILGSPALMADAREAIRSGKLKLAVLRARRAWLRAFKGRLRYSLDGGERRKASALSLICPLVSRGAATTDGLEAASLDFHGALDLFRLGIGTLVGGWRDDPAVRVQVIERGVAWAHGRLPAILDGEPHRMDGPVAIAFHSGALSAWATADAQASERQPRRAAAPLAGSASTAGDPATARRG